MIRLSKYSDNTEVLCVIKISYKLQLPVVRILGSRNGRQFPTQSFSAGKISIWPVKIKICLPNQDDDKTLMILLTVL